MPSTCGTAATTTSPTMNGGSWRPPSSAAARRWDRPDAGIWEQRGAPRHYVHSKAMAWVALDRGIRLGHDRGFDAATLERWDAVRSSIRHAVETRGVDPDRGNFVRAFGGLGVDASLLKLPLVGFVDANDDRMIATVEAIEAELTTDGFVRRYGPDDGDDTVDPSREGVFLLCSCWLVEVLAMQHRVAEARALFARIVGVANDVGLFAEQFDPRTGELLGNFPQAFTHLGVVAAERRLRTALDGQEGRPEAVRHRR